MSKFLKILFLVLEVGTLLVTLLIVGLFLFSPSSKSYLGLGPVAFVPLSGPPAFATSGPDPVSGQITDLHGVVRLPIENHILPAAVKWVFLPVILLGGSFLAFICDLLRRLFRNVEHRQSFTLQNIRLVQHLGLAILLFTILGALAKSYSTRRALEYLGNSGTLMEQEVVLAPASSNSFLTVKNNHARYHFTLDLTGLLAGLLVLALAEVFRQGRLLEDENQLTI